MVGMDDPFAAGRSRQSIEQLGRNALTRSALAAGRAWVLPTRHQAESLPQSFATSGSTITKALIFVGSSKPGELEVRGIRIDRTVPTITFVNRNLERLRGFDLFMRSLPLIHQQHSKVRVLIVGDNEPGYGGGHGDGPPLRQRMLQELAGQIDLDRIHFLGRVPHPTLMALLQASWVHVYLSYPPGLEFGSDGLRLLHVGSKGMPVEEAIEHNVEGRFLPWDVPDCLQRKCCNCFPILKVALVFTAARRRALLYDQRLTLSDDVPH